MKHIHDGDFLRALEKIFCDFKIIDAEAGDYCLSKYYRIYSLL
jgi:hypothetical protein